MQQVIYKVVFDMAEEPGPWMMLILILVLFSVFARAVHLRAGRRLGWATFIGGLAIVAWIGVIQVGPDLRLKRVLREGRASVVEGPVEQFHPRPSDRRGGEWFEVGGVRFGGVASAIAPVPPLHDGMQTRIHYTKVSGYPTILRLELAEPAR
jgi:hypothetical protein